MKEEGLNCFSKITNSSIWIVINAIIFFGLWYFPYISLSNELIDKSLKIETFGIILIGIIGFITSLLCNNSFSLLQIILFTPFMFSHPMNIDTVPRVLYYVIILLVVGMIINFLIFKPQIKLGKYFIGLSLLVIALSLGGIINSNLDIYKNNILMGLIGLVYLIAYVYLVSTSSKTSFNSLALMITMLGLYLIGQMMVYVVINGGLEEVLQNKTINVGWGITNNIAMVLLFTFPFSFYLAVKSKLLPKILFMIIGYSQVIAILINYSRGAMLALLICFPLTIIYSIFATDNKNKMVLINVIIIIFIVIGVFIVNRFNPEIIGFMKENLSKINLETINGRKEIYEQLYQGFLERPIFGNGILAMFNNDTGTYLWGHNTFIQVGYTLGIVGLIALVIHYLQKYFLVLFSNDSTKAKWVVLISFTATDIYGLLDVSYFFINFMIVLMVVLVLIESILSNNIKKFKRRQEIIELRG